MKTPRVVVAHRSHPFYIEPARRLIHQAEREELRILAMVWGPSRRKDMFNDDMYEVAMLVDKA